MVRDRFLQRKNDLFNKDDKSSKGDWDIRIKDLCNKINDSDRYCTTSSCSGRILIMKDQKKKGKGLFLFVSHDKVSKKQLEDQIENLDLSFDLKFKVDPCILHVACKTIDDAKELLDKGLSAGWKRSGIVTIKRNIVVELNATDKLEFPLVRSGKLLVGKEFIDVIFEESNKKLERSWEKIDNLLNNI